MDHIRISRGCNGSMCAICGGSDSKAPLILGGVTIGRSNDWLFGDDFLRRRRVRVSMRHLKSSALSTRRDFKARVEVDHERGKLFQNFDVAHCLCGSVRNLRLQRFRSHHRAFQIGPVDRQDQVGLAGKESLDVRKRRVVHLDQEFLVIVRRDQVDGESCYSASATNSAGTPWNGSRFVSPSTWKAETCGTLEPRLAVPGMISKRGSKSTMSEASCFRIARLPCVLAVPSAIIASSFFLPSMASSRSERLTVMVRSGFGDWKPSMLVSVAFSSSMRNFSPLSGVTRLIVKRMPSAFLLSMRIPTKSRNSSVVMARMTSGLPELAVSPCGIPVRSS